MGLGRSWSLLRRPVSAINLISAFNGLGLVSRRGKSISLPPASSYAEVALRRLRGMLERAVGEFHNDVVIFRHGSVEKAVLENSCRHSVQDGHRKNLFVAVLNAFMDHLFCCG